MIGNINLKFHPLLSSKTNGDAKSIRFATCPLHVGKIIPADHITMIKTMDPRPCCIVLHFLHISLLKDDGMSDCKHFLPWGIVQNLPWAYCHQSMKG